MLPIALQLYTVRDDLSRDFEGTLKQVSDMGYEGVEFAGLCGRAADEVKTLLKKYNLRCISAHVSIAELLDDTDKAIETYKALGAAYIAIPYLPDDFRPQAGRFDKTIEQFKYFGKKIKDAGLVMLYHNHDFEFTVIDGEYYFDTIYSKVGSDLLQTEIDTCWVNVAGEDPVKYVNKYSGRAPVVHLKDFYMKSRTKDGLYELIGTDAAKVSAEEEAFCFRPIGSGMQNIPAIIDAAEKAGTSWLVVEQDRPSGGNTPMESAKLSISYLRALK